jgi:hypothetical protein
MYIFRNEEFQTARVLHSTEIWRQFVMRLKKVKLFDTSQSLLQITDFTCFDGDVYGRHGGFTAFMLFLSSVLGWQQVEL